MGQPVKLSDALVLDARLVGEAAEHYLAEFSWIALLVVVLAVIGFSARARLRRSPR
jgi:hypothetical protein